MSVVGVDLGTLNTVIAVARNRGVEVIVNEVSNRATPTLVGFGPKSRYLGESAKTQEISNLKNTVANISRLAGRSYNDPDVQIEKNFTSAPLVDVNGQVGAEVSYLGKKEKFSATQLVAMFLTKLRHTAQTELKAPVNDIVISCPSWYTDAQRRSLLDAGDIAGIKILRLINENTAIALGYGITKLDLPGPDEKPKRVAFVDIGNSNYTCSIVEFVKGQLSVKSSATDRHFGGRDFDAALVGHFGKEFKEKFKIDINENPKAITRMLTACEKLKKILSANSSGPINIESLMNDVDVRGMIKRDEFEELIKPLLERIKVPLEKALADAKFKIEDIDTIEMVGGSTRVPAIKQAVQEYFGKPLSYTLNQDEAVARGCAFACAILSPAFRVRDFHIHDIISYPIEFTWEQDPDIPDEDTSLAVFNKGNVLPSTKILTFYRKRPFDIEARYFKPDQLPGKTAPWIGRFSVKGVKADANEDFMVCKLKARVNAHGVLNVEQGYFVEDQEVEESAPEPKEGENKDDVRQVTPTPSTTPKTAENERPSKATKLDCSRFSISGAMETDDKPKTRKVKKQVRKGELPLSAGTASLDPQTRLTLIEKENEMASEDRLVADTEDKKNELESFIYDLRNKIDEQYAEFANEDEKDKVRTKCTETEDWLYDEGEDATKAVYTAKIEELRSAAGIIIQRYNDKLEEERQERQRKFEEEEAKRRAIAEEEAAKKKAAEEEAAAAKKKASSAAAPAGAETDGSSAPAAPGADGDTEMKDANGLAVEEVDD